MTGQEIGGSRLNAGYAGEIRNQEALVPDQIGAGKQGLGFGQHATGFARDHEALGARANDGAEQGQRLADATQDLLMQALDLPECARLLAAADDVEHPGEHPLGNGGTELGQGGAGQAGSAKAIEANQFVEGGVGHLGEGRIGLGHAGGETGEGGGVEALGGKRGQQLAPTHPLIGRIGIGGIGGGDEPGLGDQRGQRSRVAIEQRAEEGDALDAGQRRHGFEPFEAAAMGEPHQHGFGLVGAMVGGQQQGGAILGHGTPDQAVARLAGGLLQAGFGLGVVPDQAAGGKPKIVRRGQHHGHLVGGFGAQGVVEAIDDELWGLGKHCGPAMGQEHQRQAIGTAGHCQADGSVVACRREQARQHIRIAQIGRQAGGHSARAISSETRVLKAGAVSG